MEFVSRSKIVAMLRAKADLSDSDDAAWAYQRAAELVESFNDTDIPAECPYCGNPYSGKPVPVCGSCAEQLQISDEPL